MTRLTAEKIKEAIEEAFQAMCASSLTLHLSRIDSKSSHPHTFLYDADSLHFKTGKARSFIREARCGEFDLTPSSFASLEQYPELQFQQIPVDVNPTLKRVWKHIPRLWVLVNELSTGIHHVSTIYRGPAMWKLEEREGLKTAKFSSDVQFAEALSKIQACEGFDLVAWQRFSEVYANALMMDFASAQTANELIH